MHDIVGKTCQINNSLPPCQEIDLSFHKLSQNGHFESKFLSSVDHHETPFSAYVILKFYLTPISVSGPESSWVSTCPKTVDSPNTVLQKITGGIFCTQFVQCNDGGAGDKCMFLSVFTYSSNPLTQICEIVQLTRWAHRKFPQHFLPSSRHKKYIECLLLLLACKFRRSQHVNLKLWLFHVIGVKRYREAESVHWGSETVYVSSPAKLHDVFEFQHSGWFPTPAPKRPLWHRRVETFDKVFAFVWTVLLVTLAVCVTCVCNLLKFQPELCFTWRILRFGKVRKLSKFTKWSTRSATLQW